MPSKEDGFLIIDEARFEYRRIGDNKPDSPTLVFLHEGLGSVSMWKEFPEQLVELTGLNAFIYSRQSYGKSSPLPSPREKDYLVNEAENILPKILKLAGIQQTLLVGHSDGASIALLFAAASLSPRPLAMALMAPHVFNEKLCIEGIRKAKLAFEKADLRQRLSVYHEDVDNAFWRWNDIWLADDFADWNIEECLSNINTSMLIIQGENDEYGSKSQVESISQHCMGKVDTLFLADCGHTPFREKNKQTLEAIRCFFKENISNN